MSTNSEGPLDKNSAGAPIKTGVSQRPFGITPQELRENRERAPLVQLFQRAVIEEREHRSKTLRNERPLRSYAAECGVYQGYSMAACLAIANSYGLEMTMIGLDTFSGLPALAAVDVELAPADAPYRDQTLFADTSLDAVRQTLAPHAKRRGFDLAQGLFKDTLRTLPEHEYFFVNIDCDLYESHLECLNYFYPRMRLGGFMYFDDYHSADYPMGRRAIDEFLAGRPEMLWHVRLGVDGTNLTKAYIRKE